MPGEFVVVVGPSGCGKSTLLNIAAGMLRPDRGRVSLDGKQVVKPGPDRAMVFQDHGLFPWLSALANVEFGLKMAGVPRSERQDRAAEALKMVHLAHSTGKLIHELSGGMRQRVAIARALVKNPRVLLADEPTGNLDEQTRDEIVALLEKLWRERGLTLIVVTHDSWVAARAQRIAVIKGGRVNTPEQVASS